jgi:hypothetical protein
VGGSFNLTIPASQPPGCPGTLRSTISCLGVFGNSAEMGAIVTEASGSFATLVRKGRPIFVHAVDQATGDAIGWRPGGALGVCGPAPPVPVDRGNITVRSGA